MKRIILFIFPLFFAFNLLNSQSISEYQYWFNNNINSKIEKQISGGSILNLDEDIDVSSSPLGYNLINIRFKDINGHYSTTYSKYFFNAGKSPHNENKTTELEYWTGESKNDARIINLTGEENINEFLDLSYLENGFHLLHIRFLNNTGLWSNTISKYVFKAGSSNSEENLITEYRYWTDDNYNSAITVKLPQPVVDYKLNAIIDLPQENAEKFNIQFLDISGLWSTVYTRAFIPEADFEVFNTINTFSFKNETTFGSEYKWDFGDGNKSELIHPTHNYSLPGVYQVSLIATNNLGKDTALKQVTVNGIREVVSNRAGNTGNATLHIYGGGFTNESTAYLEDSQGNKILPENTSWFKLDAISATFDLRGKDIGLYTVVVDHKGTLYELPDSFTIEQGTSAEPYVNISGRNAMLTGRWQTYSLNYGNTGNTDATGVPLLFVVSQPPGLEIEFPELILNQNIHLKADDYYDDFKDLPDYFEIDNFNGQYFNGRVYAFYIPVIPAGFDGSMKIRIKSNQDIEIHAWVTDPYFSSPIDKKIEDCIRIAMMKAFKDGLADLALNNLPVVGCIYGFWNQYLESQAWEYAMPDADPDYKNRQKSWGETIASWGNSTLDLTVLIFNCAKDFIAPLKAYSVAVQVAVLMNNIKGNYLIDRECREKYKPLSQENKKIRAVTSLDPNEIVGPSGFNNDNYTLNNINYHYTIFFENLNTASAPAQEVIILDTLDASKFDFSTFSFGKVSWQNKQISPLPGLTEFTLDYDLKEENNNLLRINAKFNPITGIIFWQFITLDPETMDLTEDPFGGFLPPNKNSPEGEGFVQFFVSLKDNIEHNETIKNSANIYFDLNEPIVTNTYNNTIDIAPPTSKLTGIYTTQEENLFRIHSESEDDNSGVRHLLIYTSINEGEYFPLLTTNKEKFFVELEPDSTYYFFSQAIDSVGNVESLKSNYEVSNLIVNVGSYENIFDSFSLAPNPASDYIELLFKLEVSNSVLITIYDYSGKTILTKYFESVTNKQTEKIGLHDIHSGKYLIHARIGNTNVIRMLNIVR